MKIKLWSFICCCNLLFSQQYEMIDTATFDKRNALKHQFEERYEKYNKALKNQYKGKLYKNILKSNQDFQESFLEKVDENHFVFDERIQKLVNSILENVIETNASLKNSAVQILISKDIGPNAGIFMDGTLVINLDLIRYLDNEDQLAAVICHELGHDVLNHGTKSVEEHAQKMLSKEFKEKSKSIKKKKYGKYSKAFEILKTILYTDSELSRKRELEADSVGYRLFKNTSYNPNEFATSLRILKELDDYQENIKDQQILDTIDYKRLFDLPNQPFKTKWLKQEDFSDYNYDLYTEKIDKDSISSHPEIEKRITDLKSNFKELQENYTTKEPSDLYKEFQQVATYERIPNLYHQEAYGISVYYILQMMRNEQKYDTVFLKEWLGYNFDQLYTAKKEYKYNRYVDQINPKEQSKTYVQFLNFMWNLGLTDIKNIADYYKK